MINSSRLYTLKEAREFTGLCKSAAYVLIKAGRLQAIKIGGRTLIKGSEIQRFVNDQPKIGGIESNTTKAA